MVRCRANFRRLPCFVFLLTYYVLKTSELKKVSIARRCTQVILCAANPFFPAFLKLQTLFSYLKNFTNFWRGNKVLGIDSRNSDKEAQWSTASEQCGASVWGHSWISSSVYYSAVRHGCLTGIRDDCSNGFPVPARVFPQLGLGVYCWRWVHSLQCRWR